jgi:HEAT repeat protein
VLWDKHKNGSDKWGNPFYDRLDAEAQAMKVVLALGADSAGDLAAATASPSEGVRNWARRCLGQIGQKDPSAVERLTRDKRTAVREAAFAVLSGLTLEKVPAEAEAALGDESFAVRAAAAAFLKQHAYQPSSAKRKAQYRCALREWDQAADVGAEALEPLQQALAEAEICADAGRALARAGNEGRAILEKASKDERWFVRKGAAAGLGAAGAGDATTFLVPLLEDADGDVRAEAAVSLGRRQWKPATSRQQAALAVAMGLFDSLEQVGKAAAGPLETAAKDKNPELRMKAAAALLRIDRAKALSALASLLGDWETGPDAANLLANEKWVPGTDEEKVRLLAAQRKGKALGGDWDKAGKVLLADLDGNADGPATTAAAVIVAMGKDDLLPRLIQRYRQRPTTELARVLWDSDREALRDLAADFQDLWRGKSRKYPDWGQWRLRGFEGERE